MIYSYDYVSVLSEIKGIKIPLNEQEIELAKKVAYSYDSRNWQGNGWRRGLIKDPEFLGVVGEIAWSKLTGRPFNDKSIKGGDGGSDDVLPNGKKVNQKTAGKAYGKLLVRSTDPYGKRPIELTSDIYVSAYFDQMDNTVFFLGYATVEELRELPDVRAMKGSHKNKAVAWESLHPLEEILAPLNLYSETGLVVTT